jgi:serine protease AprX
MKRFLAALAAACFACMPGLPARAAPAVGTEILQFAPRLHAAGALQARRRLLASLRALGLAPHRFSVLPMVVVSGTPAQLTRARSLPGVLYAHPAQRLKLLLDKSVPLVYRGPPAPVRAANGGGSGIRVAIVDTGIDGLHPDLGSRVLENIRFVAGAEVRCPTACSTDDNGHGTEVAGVVAGPGRPGGLLAGMTPGADLVGLTWDTTKSPLDAVALDAFDYVLAHPELNIRVVNNSWENANVHGHFDPTDAINQATKILHDAGVTVVFGAGNNGQGLPAAGQPYGSSNCIDGDPNGKDCAFSTYAGAPWVISVAAGSEITAGSAPEDQGLWIGSARGDPRPDRVAGIDVRYQPTLTAPGELIMTTAATVGQSFKCVVLCSNAMQPFYAQDSGTSLAAPHVSGAITLLQSAARTKLGRYLTPDEVKRVLVEGAAPMTKPWSEPPPCDTVTELTGICPVGPQTGHFAPWEVGAGYLDVPGALRALDRLVEDEQS